MIDRTSLLYYQAERGKYGQEWTKIGRERTKILFLLLQINNRSIDCIGGPFASGVLHRMVCVRNFKAFRGISNNQYARLLPYI